jgi:hypothetical protein
VEARAAGFKKACGFFVTIFGYYQLDRKQMQMGGCTQASGNKRQT